MRSPGTTTSRCSNLGFGRVDVLQALDAGTEGCLQGNDL
jgi:hypothetical protein